MTEEERLNSIRLYLMSIEEISFEIERCKNPELIRQGIHLINDKANSAKIIIDKVVDKQ